MPSKIAAFRRKPVAPPKNPRLASLIAEQARGEGFSPSRMPGVKFMRSTRHVPRCPIVYEPSIVIIAQGRKSGYLGERKFVYDADHYLVLSVPLPFECETEGTEEAPVLGVAIGVTPALVGELLVQMETAALTSSAELQAIESTTLDEALFDAAVRLLECLRTESDARILGPQIVREITYRVLSGRLGCNLRALASPHHRFGQISRVLQRIHSDCARSYDMESLAKEAGMSVSTFHLHFKAVTTWPPLQYVKNVRLHKARMLMVHEGINAGTAASQVGYESASQFSREFKRFFGGGPAEEAARLRQSLMRLA